MKNIFLLPTEESSRIGRFVDTQKLILRSEKDIPRGESVNIYITSDEEVNVNDYVIVSCSEEEIEEVRVVTGYYNEQFLFDGKSQIHMNYCKKIIFTTDFRLAPNVQKIDDEFLEWFVKNPNCEFVHAYNDRVVGYEYDNYTIIIPTEEPIKSLSYEDFRKRASTKLLELFDNDYSRYSDEELCDDNHFYANCIYWENKLKEETKPHSFCETPGEKCTMNYCDENGCQNRKRNLVETEKYPIGGYAPGSYMCECVTCKKKFMGDKRAAQCEPCALEMVQMVKLFKKETVVEAAERYENSFKESSGTESVDFQAGAKWQLENMPIHIYTENTYVHIEDGTIIVEKNDNSIISYSEEDLREAFKQSRQCKIFEKDMPPVYEEFEDWFKQFKKK
jgi:hypothetical protein